MEVGDFVEAVESIETVGRQSEITTKHVWQTRSRGNHQIRQVKTEAHRNEGKEPCANERNHQKENSPWRVIWIELIYGIILITTDENKVSQTLWSWTVEQFRQVKIYFVN